MADDPRFAPAARAILHGPMECLGSGTDLLTLTRSVLDAADGADPLRALLADVDGAAEFAAQARYEAWRAAWIRQGGSKIDAPPWEDLAEVMRRHWRTETDHACSGVLAALREVAGL